MNEDLKDLLQELVEEFDMNSGFPSTEIYADGEWQWGVVKDSLADILHRIHEILSEEE